MQAGFSRLLILRDHYLFGRNGRDTVGKRFIGNEKYYQNIPWGKGT